MQGVKFLVQAGIKLFHNMYRRSCFEELVGKDSQHNEEKYIYDLSTAGPLGGFKKIVLVASEHDRYVTEHSARIEPYNLKQR